MEMDTIVDKNNKNYTSVNGSLYSKDGKILIQYAPGRSSKTFKLPSTVEEISRLALLKCANVNKFSVQKGNKFFKAKNGNLYNYDYSKLIKYAVNKQDNVVTVNDVSEIGAFAFENCNSLTKLTVGGSVKVIGLCAFRGCKYLTSVKIQSGVEKLENAVFDGCDYLTKLELPSSINCIDGDITEENYNVVYVVEKDSYAYNYCRKNDKEYKLKRK